MFLPGVELRLADHVVNSFPPRRYFVLTDAGKPVFISNEEDRDGENLVSVIGLMQALISVFIDDGDKLRCINAGKTRITFLLRPPLYYACVSAWGEPASVVSAPPRRVLGIVLMVSKQDANPS